MFLAKQVLPSCQPSSLDQNHNTQMFPISDHLFEKQTYKLHKLLTTKYIVILFFNK